MKPTKRLRTRRQPGISSPRSTSWFGRSGLRSPQEPMWATRPRRSRTSSWTRTTRRSCTPRTSSSTCRGPTHISVQSGSSAGSLSTTQTIRTLASTWCAMFRTTMPSCLNRRARRTRRESFDPELPGSLIDAVTWFLVATAIRRARGQRTAHSSMLIHTTHYIAAALRDEGTAQRPARGVPCQLGAGNHSPFLTSFDTEGTRAAEVATLPLPMWSEVEQELASVLRDVRVVVDNGSSDDRLDYNRVARTASPSPRQ